MFKGREIADYLADILTAIDEIDDFTRGMNYEDFTADKKTINAVIRSLEVLGEATKPRSFPQKIPRHSLEQNGWPARCPYSRLYGCRFDDRMEGGEGAFARGEGAG